MNKFSKSTWVVISCRFGITECLKKRIGCKNLLFNCDALSLCT